MRNKTFISQEEMERYIKDQEDLATRAKVEYAIWLYNAATKSTPWFDAFLTANILFYVFLIVYFIGTIF